LLINPILLLIALAAGQPEAPSSVVGGRVVDAASGRPIAGAIVIPFGGAALDTVTQDGHRPVGTPRLLTNAGGYFVVRGLRKGSLVLVATKKGYVDAMYGQRRPAGSAQPIAIKEDGERIGDLEIRMWKHAVIAGTVLDENGDPAIGTRIQAYRRNGSAVRRRYEIAGEGSTDDRGAYRIPQLLPGDYIVAVPSTQTSVPREVMESFFTGTPISQAKRVELGREFSGIGSVIAPPGSQYAIAVAGQVLSLPNGTLTQSRREDQGILIYPTLYYPAAATAAQAGRITVGSGEERSGVDLQARPERGVRLAGTLIGPDGPSATTGLHLVNATSDESVDPIEVATTLTDSGGAFTFPAIPPGQYVLRVLRVPRPPVNLDEMTHVSATPAGTMTISSTPNDGVVRPPPVPADATLVAQMPLNISEHDMTDLIVPLAQGPRVSGRVDFEGTIDKPTTESLTNMRITLDPADGSRLDDATLSMRTGHPEGNGEFKTYGVPPGQYVVRVSPLPAGWSLKSALHQGRDIADVPLELGSKDASGVVITFTDRPAGISGVIRGTEGPDGTAIALAYSVERAAWFSSGAFSRRMRTARAAKDGSYSIQGLPTGEYYLVAVREDLVGDWQDPELLEALTRLARTIHLVDGEQKTVDLRAAAINSPR
jgi:hypothetical protein